ncbi:hypothetical protein Moror_10561 [Moniliophthora roreri MCA 2997]|uniref:Uncharacterized protein n=1 Tax=Moniliophthora roreri (strain MCA 2997) TaxID=1381753 RepID=V2XH58_MONRO|nr:hypothetical protein Moror_10561 [Moniliophthora roreri MCA 2997]
MSLNHHHTFRDDLDGIRSKRSPPIEDLKVSDWQVLLVRLGSVFGASGSPAPCKWVLVRLKAQPVGFKDLRSDRRLGCKILMDSANSESKGDLPNKGDGALLDIRVQLFRKTYSIPTTHNLVTVKKVGARLIAVIFEEYHRLNDLSYLFDGAGLCERGFPPYIITQMYSWRCLPVSSLAQSSSSPSCITRGCWSCLISTQASVLAYRSCEWSITTQTIFRADCSRKLRI